MTLEVDIACTLEAFRLEVQFAAQSGVTALFGRSGAGKTSVINMISGLRTPTRGRITVDGEILFDAAHKINLATRKRRVGVVFQESRLFPHLNVRRNLLYGERFAPHRERYVKLDQIIDLLGIEPLLARRPRMLSGGERQRVAIGRALLASPRLLLMDEPLASLDAERRQEILPYIERLRDDLGLPIVYVSHQFEEVARLADTLVVMDAGQVRASGPFNEVGNQLDADLRGDRHEAGTVFTAYVEIPSTESGLMQLTCSAATLLVPHRQPLPKGTAVRVQVHAREVAIATSAPRGLSIQNVLPARIVESTPEPDACICLRLDANGLPLLARITRKAAQELKLAVGQDVFALIKSVAIDRHGTRPNSPRDPTASVSIHSASTE